MSAPADVLLVRAMNHFERALLELGNREDSTADVQSAADWIDKGLTLVKEVLER